MGRHKLLVQLREERHEASPLLSIWHNCDCRTSDGKSGETTVNSQKFELPKGSLILVATAGGTIRMKQLQREGLAVLLPNGTRVGFQKWKTDPEISDFFANEKSAK